jgi:SpoIID/LytB domain protein
MEGQQELAFRPRGRARLRVRGGAVIEIPAGETLRVRALHALPAALAYRPLLGDARYADQRRLEGTRRLWEGRGAKVLRRITGGAYGIAGRVLDNRRVSLVADGDGSESSAREFAEESLARYGGRTGVFTEVLTRPSGMLEVLGPAGGRVALGDALVTLEVDGDGGFTVGQVEHDVGYAAHGYEDRAYRGRLHVTLDSSGRLAAILAIALEELLRGLVPSEIPAGSPREALKAQAVTARSNVLAQIGTRHLTDPYVLCSEVHCQAYRGEAAQALSTDVAVRQTSGQALFGGGDHALVDAVYSAMCGGHGEDNDAVWATLPNPSLRGLTDLPPEAAKFWRGGLRDETRLRAFLAAAPPAWCSRASGSRKDRYRWERRFAPAELDAFMGGLASGVRSGKEGGSAASIGLAPQGAPGKEGGSAASIRLGVGHVRSLEVTRRGVSGRARTLVVSGDAGRAVVEGELRIRRLLGNLPSAMFVVDRDGDALVLHGGGWGHGAGMCQWGAVGRAEAGQEYREILRAYYSGAEVARIY